MIKNKYKEIITIVLVTVVFILIALNSNKFYTRADLTENKMFTISTVSKDIVKSIPETVRITYFISDRIRTITPVAGEIEDILHEFSANSNGRLFVTSIDPVKANITSMAESYDVMPRQIEVFEKNEQSFALVYSGITIQYLDRHESIPFIIGTDTLEYEITSRIKKLVDDTEIKAGIIIGDNRKSIESNYTYLFERLEDLYSVEIIQPGSEIPRDFSVLAVLGNRDLSEGDLLYIDDYIMDGGKVLFGLEGVDVDMRMDLNATPLYNNPALAMMEKYGIRINNNLVLDKYAKRITMRGSFPIPYPQWVGITGENVSIENPITSRFTGLDLLWASSIDVIDSESGLDYHRLLSSTDQAWDMKEDRFTTNPYELNSMIQYMTENLKQYDLGYVVSGNFKSAFTNRVSPGTRIVVIGDSDFASDLIEFSDSPYNIYFIENTLEWLAGEESLLDIKTKSKRDLRLSKIETQEGRIKAILFIYLVNLILVPLAVIIYAIVRFIGRRRKEA